MDSQNDRNDQISPQGKTDSCWEDGDAETPGKLRLVCVEPAQIALEGVLAARGLSRTFTKAPQPTRPQEAINSVTSCDQLSSTQTGMYVHVMVVNFSHQEIKLPKATVLGVAEETSASIVADINDEVNP